MRIAKPAGVSKRPAAAKAARKTPATARVATKAAKKVAKKPAVSGNGMQRFSFDAPDAAIRPRTAVTKRQASAVSARATSARTDPETAAKGYLKQAMPPKPATRRSRTDPRADALAEFKSLGLERNPLTRTTLVKFRQYVDKIPVYGSLAVVELDDANRCLSINGATAVPDGVGSVARLAPARALAVVAKAVRRPASSLRRTPRLHYYYDQQAATWTLAYIIEDVSQRVATARSRERGAPVNDYVVDANDGTLLATLPRVAGLVAERVSVTDALGRKRAIVVEKRGDKRRLHDPELNVTTYGFRYRDPDVDYEQLPGALYALPPKPWPAEAVSAHANCAEVAKFLRNVLKRDNIDNLGGNIASTVNCWEQADGTGVEREWRNAYWNGEQMVYGQVVLDDGSQLSIAAMKDVVAHELFHGVIDATSRLEYRAQSGALNESYADVFGVIIANFRKRIDHWTWRIGRDFNGRGTWLRSMSHPGEHEQPAHMRDFLDVPSRRYSYDNDYGWVHDNSGIHNHAAYRLITTRRGSGYLFTPRQLAAMFFVALTVHLSRTSGFGDSRRALLAATRSLFRDDTAALLKAKLAAVERAFDAVGID